MNLQNLTKDELALVGYVGYVGYHQKQTIKLTDLERFSDVLSKDFLEGILRKLLSPDTLLQLLHPSVFHAYNVTFKDLRFTNLAYLELPFYFESCWFRNVDLRKTDLTKAKFYDCDFIGASLIDVKGFNPDIEVNVGLENLPSGELTGYKLVHTVHVESGNIEDAVLEVKIPQEAERSKSAGFKCRASILVPLRAFTKEGEDISPEEFRFYSLWDNDFEYVIGKEAYPNGWDNNRWQTCSEGLHFFRSFDIAKKYSF